VIIRFVDIGGIVDNHCFNFFFMTKLIYHGIFRAVVTVILLLLDLQLPMQSVPITTDVVIFESTQGEVYNIT
jgi:hypothetical protein